METINVLGPTNKEGQLPFQLEATPVDGTYKAIQEWVLCFLTKKGSVKVAPTYGCDFLYYLSSGAIRSTADVQEQFNTANEQVMSNIPTPTSTNITVQRAVLMNYSVVERDLKRILIMDIGFEFSDGTATRINLGVN
jgi:hypothetical protein